jgi:hypothetical protein
MIAEKAPRFLILMIFDHVNNINASKYLNSIYLIELEHNDTNYRFSLNASTKLNYGTIKLYHLILNILNFQFLFKVYTNRHLFFWMKQVPVVYTVTGLLELYVF